MNFLHRLRNKFKIKGNSNQIKIEKKVRIASCKITIKGDNNILLISSHSILRGVEIEIVGNNCSIEIGSNCVIGRNCYLSAKEENTHLVIKNDCMLSRNIKIMTSDGHPIFFEKQRLNEAKNIYIGNHVWLADNVTILKNVRIEDNSIVGINSTVTSSIPPNSIAVGNPAKVVKDNISWKN